MNATTVKEDGTSSTKEKFLTLCLCWLVIVIGNTLVIVVQRIYGRKQIPDYLILVLAVIDLVNAFGPVLFSVIMYASKSRSFEDFNSTVPCHFFNSTATLLRLSACFLMTMMAVDRAISVAKPLYYRTALQLRTIKRWTIAAIATAALIACVPITGATPVQPHQQVCSFDFESGYALFIATLGYIQLIAVLICYIVVVHGLLRFAGKWSEALRPQIHGSPPWKDHTTYWNEMR